MTALHWLEKTLHKLYQQVYFIAVFVFFSIGFMIAADLVIHMSWELPPVLVGQIGRLFSKVPILFGTLAVIYYMLREFQARVLLKGRMSKAAWMKPYISSLLTILQLIHPALGVLAISFAAIHGYMMWVSMGGLQGGNVIISGLALMTTSTVIALVGTSMQVAGRRQVLRYSHRVLVILNVALYSIHRIAMKPDFFTINF